MAVATTNYTDIAFAKETVPGTVDTNPQFKVLPTTGGSPVSNITTTVSETIRSDRQTADLIKTDVEVSGDLNYELDYPNYKTLMKALLQSDAVLAEDAVAAVGVLTITGTGAGDGDVAITIDAVPYSYTVVVSDTPTMMAAGLAADINTGSTHIAQANEGIVTVVDVTPGVAGNSVVIADTTDDTGATLVVTAPAGGVAAVASTTGFNITGCTLNTTNSTLAKAGLEGLVNVGDVFYMSSATNPDNDMPRVVSDTSGTDLITFSPDVPVGTTDASSDVVMLATEIHTNGSTCDIPSYTFRKRVSACGSSSYNYYYKGCMINMMSFNFATASILSGTLGIVGLTEEVSSSAKSGEYTIDSLPYSIMNSISSVGAIVIEGVNLGVCKFNSMDVSYDNQINLAKSIGVEGACSAAAFSVQITSNIEAYFSNVDMYNAFLNSTGFGVTAILEDADGNVLGLNMPYCKFETLDTPISGEDQFLMQSGSMRALMDPVLGYTFKLSMVDGA